MVNFKKVLVDTVKLLWSRKIVLSLIVAGLMQGVYAQTPTQKPARILFLLDASSSMLDNWTDRESRFAAAGRIISTIADSIQNINREVAFAVRVFGSQYPAQEQNCFDSRVEVSFNNGNASQVRTRLQYLTPRGYSPIAWSLKQTAEDDFNESDQYAYSIILVTDGGESCGGDICAVTNQLLAQKISFKPYILSLVDYVPLRQQYECLGKYLQITKEEEIKPAVQTIINDNRPVFLAKTSGLRTVSSAPPPAAPVARNIVITSPPIKQEPVSQPVQKEIPLPEKVVPEVKEPVQPKTPAQPEDNTAVRPVHRTLDRIVLMKNIRKRNILYTLPEPVPVSVPRLMVKLTIEPDPPQPKPTPTPAQRTNKEASPAKPVARPPTPAKAGGEEALEFTSEEETAKESSLQIYFTNGQGKFYLTEPRMVIRDSRTQKEVKNIYRNVSGGEPDPILLPPGMYDIAIPGGRGKANNVVVEANAKKKIYIKVGRGALAFYHPTAPDKPVKGYTAFVSKRFEPGPVVKQRSDEELPYDPANYHIEINTLPKLIYNIDLDFNSVKLVEIPEPGTLQITNRSRVGKVQLWNERGDAFMPFHEMEINGDVGAQKRDLLPGIYQVRYFKTPRQANQRPEIVVFSIKGNQTTNLELGN